MICAKFDWNWPSGSGEEDFFNSSSYFRNFVIVSPLKGRALHLNKLEFPSPKDILGQVWLTFAHWFWRKRFFKFVNVFVLFRNYILLEKGGEHLHLKKLNPLHQKMICAKFVWKCSSGFGKEFLDLSIYFCNFFIISFWKRAGPSFEQAWYSFRQGWFVPN